MEVSSRDGFGVGVKVTRGGSCRDSRCVGQAVCVARNCAESLGSLDFGECRSKDKKRK